MSEIYYNIVFRGIGTGEDKDYVKRQLIDLYKSSICANQNIAIMLPALTGFHDTQTSVERCCFV